MDEDRGSELERVVVGEWEWARDAAWGQATRVGRLILTCGVAPFDKSGVIIGKGDFEAQFRLVVSNLKELLASAGSDMDHILRQHVYLRRTEDLEEFKRLREELYRPPYPAGVTVVVNALAFPDMLVEIACEAVTASTPAVAEL